MSFLDAIDQRAAEVADGTRIEPSERKHICRYMLGVVQRTDEKGEPCNCPRKFLYGCRLHEHVRGHRCETCEDFEALPPDAVALKHGL